MVGITQQRVAQLVATGVLRRDGSAGEWLAAYCERLREQAGGRGRELTIERASLTRAQRVGQEIKNAAALRGFAPVALLAAVLADVSATVASRFECLAEALGSRFPQLDGSERAQLAAAVAAVQLAWLDATSELALPAIEGQGAEADEDADLAEGVATLEDEDAPP
jgi:phage terminase Nu1 subunit (DNA packaging protein)